MVVIFHSTLFSARAMWRGNNVVKVLEKNIALSLSKTHNTNNANGPFCCFPAKLGFFLWIFGIVRNIALGDQSFYLCWLYTTTCWPVFYSSPPPNIAFPEKLAKYSSPPLFFERRQTRITSAFHYQCHLSCFEILPWIVRH